MKADYQLNDRSRRRETPRRQGSRARRGAVALIAMVFLVLFSTLGLAMYAMATLNVQTSDNFTELHRAHGTAESGLRWIAWRLAQLDTPRTATGNITDPVAVTLWPAIRDAIAADLQSLPPDQRATTWDGNEFRSSWIRTYNNNDPLNPNGSFQIRIRQYPTPITPGPRSPKWLRVTSVGVHDGSFKSVSIDFRIDKKIKFAMVGKVPMQAGRNTFIEGPVAVSTTNKFPPFLMLSDFKHLTTSLRTRIEAFEQFLENNHQGYDNRISVHNAVEFSKAALAGYNDTNGDSYIDEYDLFLAHFDANNDRRLTQAEFTDPVTGQMYDSDLFNAIDSLAAPLNPSDPPRQGYKDGVVDNRDSYTKVRGRVTFTMTANAWSTNLAPQGKTITDMMQGPVSGDDSGAPAVEFGVPSGEIFDLAPSNFNTASFRLKTGPENGALTNTATLKVNKVLAATDANGGTSDEKTPWGSTAYQATYRRPVFRNMTLRNCRIPIGLNAMFDNVVFEGVTFVDLTTNITNASGATTTSSTEGMNWSKRMKSGTFSASTVLTTTNSFGFSLGNNLRFNNCTFKGPLASSVPTAYSHFTNSWEFTGATMFSNTWSDPNSGQTTATILAPQTNIELGSFTDPSAAPSTLVGVVVAGNIDIRGNSVVDGSIIVTGDGAGNTTMGWFGPSDGSTDLSPMPNATGGAGYGSLIIRYNNNRALPDGINMPLDFLPDFNSYSEGQ